MNKGVYILIRMQYYIIVDEQMVQVHQPGTLNEEIMNTKTETAVSTSPAVAEKAAELIALGPDAKMVDVIKAVNELIKLATAARNRGPSSTRTMVEADARRIMLGDLKDASHTKAAEALGLSYGQIYSARKGFTFKTVYQAALKAAAKK